MLRTQLVRPALCGFACELEQAWDTATGELVAEVVRQRCPRHAGMADAFASAAITEESERFTAVVAAVDAVGLPVMPAVLASGARIRPDGVLEIRVGLARKALDALAPRLPARVVIS